MGRIKTQFIKRLTNDLLEAHSSKFSKDFEENKQIVTDHTDVTSKKIRNVIAGYVSRKKKAIQS